MRVPLALVVTAIVALGASFAAAQTSPTSTSTNTGYTQPPPPNDHLQVRLWVDGLTQFHARGLDAWLVVASGTLPPAVNNTVMLNGYKWIPAWSAATNPSRTDVYQMTWLGDGIPENARAEFKPIFSRGKAFLEQQPVDNGGELVVTLDDSAFAGGDWYEFNLFPPAEYGNPCAYPDPDHQPSPNGTSSGGAYAQPYPNDPNARQPGSCPPPGGSYCPPPPGPTGTTYNGSAGGDASSSSPPPSGTTQYQCPPAHNGPVLFVGTLIDGVSILHVKGETVWWEHRTGAAPGRAFDREHPTQLSPAEWFPTWPFGPFPAKGVDCACSSEPRNLGLGFSIQAGTTAEVVVQHARGKINVDQPDPARPEFVVTFDDSQFQGAEPYGVELRLSNTGPGAFDPKYFPNGYPPGAYPPSGSPATTTGAPGSTNTGTTGSSNPQDLLNNPAAQEAAKNAARNLTGNDSAQKIVVPGFEALFVLGGLGAAGAIVARRRR